MRPPSSSSLLARTPSLTRAFNAALSPLSSRGFSYVSKDPPGTSDLAKYALDVDGNGWSARFPRLMAARSLVVKATAFTEWNGQTFPAHYGYVPANNDYSDIESILSLCVALPCSLDVVASARSDRLTLALTHHHSLQTPELDAVAREMADVGRCWKARTMRVVDMQAYSTSALRRPLTLVPSPNVAR